MRGAIVACVGSLAMAGCASHIELRAPPASAPVQERVAAYDALKPLSYHQTTVITYGTIGSSSSVSTDYMQLNNGNRVYFPEDLLPIVPDDSASAKAAQASESKRETAHLLTLGSVASVAAGAVLVILPFTQASGGHVNGTPVLFGLGLALLGGAGFGIGAHFVSESAQDEAATAYETFDRSLLDRLNLCAHDSTLGDCPR